jgi:hypothetical protein
MTRTALMTITLALLTSATRRRIPSENRRICGAMATVLASRRDPVSNVERRGRASGYR